MELAVSCDSRKFFNCQGPTGSAKYVLMDCVYNSGLMVFCVGFSCIPAHILFYYFKKNLLCFFRILPYFQSGADAHPVVILEEGNHSTRPSTKTILAPPLCLALSAVPRCLSSIGPCIRCAPEP